MPYCVKTTTDYEDIKSLIVQKKVYTPLLEQIKLTFKEEIASPRRYGCIKTVSDLVVCLEGLDALSEYNIEPLCQIADYFADDEIFMALDKYEEPVEQNNINMYALERSRERCGKLEIKNDTEKSKVVKQQSIPIPELTNSKRGAIYELVAQEIGSKWRNLGRELEVRAGDLDNIERKHILDLKSRVFDIFYIFEQNPRYSVKEHLFKICDALDKCKRKDIRKSIEQIMLNDDLS